VVVVETRSPRLGRDCRSRWRESNVETSAGVDPLPAAVGLDRDERCRGTVFRLAVRFGRGSATVSLPLLIASAVLTSCGNHNDEGSASAPTPTSRFALDTSSRPAGESDRTVIKTRIVGFTGRVLTGSILGSTVFCRGGTVRHARGNLEIGFPAVNVFSCPTGSLRIGFGPGPDQMDYTVQTSNWRVLGGSGSFVGATGEGTMQVKWEQAEAALGRETFRGVIVLP
jgi:hypothetical protein